MTDFAQVVFENLKYGRRAEHEEGRAVDVGKSSAVCFAHRDDPVSGRIS